MVVAVEPVEVVVAMMEMIYMPPPKPLGISRSAELDAGGEIYGQDTALVSVSGCITKVRVLIAVLCRNGCEVVPRSAR